MGILCHMWQAITISRDGYISEENEDLGMESESLTNRASSFSGRKHNEW